MRLIDADRLLQGYEDHDFIDTHVVWNAPTVEAEPVRHGKWVDTETFKRPWFRHHIFECSVCRNTLDMDGVNAGRGDANYCPNCGAKMDGREEE